MPYAVRTPVFEGPFDVLLHLIARQQVDLYEVSLASIVDDFLVEMEQLAVPDLEVATEFLVIAATLVELKTRRLLPAPAEADLGDDLALFEERDLLVARLLECKTFKDVAGALERRAGEAARSRPRTVGPEPQFLALAPDLLAGVEPADIRAAYLRATLPKPAPTVDLHHVAPIRISVRDTAEELVGLLPTLGRVSFRRLTSGLTARLEVIVRFLAVLELYKQDLVELEQPSTFGALEIVWTGGEAPLSERAWAEIAE